MLLLATTLLSLAIKELDAMHDESKPTSPTKEKDQLVVAAPLHLGVAELVDAEVELEDREEEGAGELPMQLISSFSLRLKDSYLLGGGTCQDWDRPGQRELHLSHRLDMMHPRTVAVGRARLICRFHRMLIPLFSSESPSASSLPVLPMADC